MDKSGDNTPHPLITTTKKGVIMEDDDFMCSECGAIIGEDEWEMFGGKCEECGGFIDPEE